MISLLLTLWKGLREDVDIPLWALLVPVSTFAAASIWLSLCLADAKKDYAELGAEYANYKTRAAEDARLASNIARAAEWEHARAVAEIRTDYQEKLNHANELADAAAASIRAGAVRVRHELCAAPAAPAAAVVPAPRRPAAGTDVGPAAGAGASRDPDGAGLIGQALGAAAKRDALIADLRRLVVADRKTCNGTQERRP